MEYGGITPIGLPPGWPILIDAAVAEAGEVVIGSGIRGSKLFLPASSLAALPDAEVIEGWRDSSGDARSSSHGLCERGYPHARMALPRGRIRVSGWACGRGPPMRGLP